MPFRALLSRHFQALSVLVAVVAAAPVQPTSLWATEFASLEAAASQAVQDTSAYARRQGWFPRDKALHFGVSAAASGGVYVWGRALGLGRWPSVVTSSVLVGAAGVLREVLDPQDQVNHVSRRFLSRRDLV